VKKQDVVKVVMKTGISTKEAIDLLCGIPEHQAVMLDSGEIEIYQQRKGPKEIFGITLNNETEEFTFEPQLLIAITTHFARNRVATSIKEIGKMIQPSSVTTDLENAIECFLESPATQTLSSPIIMTPDTYSASAG
jgi:hypothetical protein